MKKLILSLLTSAIAAVSLPTQAQQLLYQWAFTNATDTATNSSPTFATNAGTGVLGIGIVAGATAPGTLTYFTNAGVGPSLSSTNPLVTNVAAGAYVCNGQSYNGSPSFVAIATNLNLGEQPGGGLYQYTVTFWLQLGPLADSGDFPRFVQFGAETNYDVGGKGVGNLEGVGSSVNDDIAGGGFNAVQDGTGSNPAGANPAISITNIFPGGIANDGVTWYFWAMTYDGTQTTTNFITWLGTLSNAVQAVTPATENAGEIKFTTNATVLLGNDNVNSTARGLTTGMIADVRIYEGLVSQSNLDNIRQFLPIVPSNPPVTLPVIVQQPVSGNTYVGGSRTFSVSVTGNPSVFGYQWKSNNVTIAGATNAGYTLSNVTLATTGSFTCTITNSFGPTNTTAATITVSTPAANSFASMVLANNPYSFWKVNESSNTAVAISDYIRGNDGFVIVPPAGPSNATYGFGPEAPSYLGFPANNTDIGSVLDTPGQIDLTGPGNYPNTGMTMLGWVYMTNDGTAGAGLIFNLVSDTGGGFGMVLGSGNELDYEWGPAAPAAFASSGLDIPLNQWALVALVISTNATPDTNATIYLGSPSTGLVSVQDSTANFGDIIASGADTSPLALGRTTVTSSENGSYYDSSTVQFNEVAIFNSALSPQTIADLYQAGVGLSLSGVPDQSNPGHLLLTYPTGILYSSTNSVAGPYIPVPGASSPYDAPIVTAIGSVFYRVGLH